MQRTMKPRQRADDTSQSCSCTSCDYKKETDRHSLSRINNRGSRANKLAQYKNIPLREQKLIEKLIKTRAIYDDIKKQLLSENNVSINEANLKPRKRVTPKEVDNIEKSAILQLVDFIDKGRAALGTNALNNCCSCCSCSSNIHLHNNKHRDVKYIRHIRARSGSHLASKSSVISNQRQRKGSNSSATFKIKRIRSDPCRCTLKFSDLLKHQSNLLFKQKSKPPKPELMPELLREHYLSRENHKKSLHNIYSGTVLKDHLDFSVKKSANGSDLLEHRLPLHSKKVSELTNLERIPPDAWNPLSTYDKKQKSTKYPICKCALRDMEGKIKKAFQKLKYSKVTMKNHLQLGAAKSIEKLKLGKDKVKDRIQSMQSDYVKYSVPLPLMVEEKNHYRFESVKTGSITTDKIPVTTEEKKEYQFDSVKEGGVTKGRKRTEHLQKGKEIQRHFKVKKDSITKFNEKLKQIENLRDYECDSKCFPEVCIPEECFEKNKLRNVRRGIQSPQMPDINNGRKMNTVDFLASDINIQLTEEVKAIPAETKAQNNETKFGTKAVGHPNIPVKTKNKKHDVRTVNQKQKSSEITIISKNTATSGHTLKRCLCTLKLRPKHTRRKVSKKGIVPSSVNSFTSRYIPRRAKKLQSSITAYKIDVQSKKQNIKKKTIERRLPRSHNRQMVRVGSTFSFNIEFIKENPLHTSSSPVINKELNTRKYQVRKQKIKQGGFDSYGRYQNRTSIQTENKEIGTMGSLSKQCLCTFDVMKNVKVGSNANKINTSTETHLLVRNPTTKPTKTNDQKIRYIKLLEPFECEPNVCLPGKCVPYKCFERIMKRETRYFKEFGTTTDPSRMKSISSMTHNLEKSKSTLAKSNLISRHTYMKQFNKNPMPLSVTSKKRNSMQSVTIGSTFSFNIQFHKSGPEPSDSNHNILWEDVVEPVRKIRNHQRRLVNRKIVDKDKANPIKPMMKRCFCTLKLQNKNKKSHKSHILAVTKLIVGKTKINNQENILTDQNNFYHDSYRYSDMQFTKCDFKFKEMQEYFHKKTLHPLQAPVSKKIGNDVDCEIERNLLNYCTYSETCFTKSKKAIKSLCFNKPYFTIRNATNSNAENLYKRSDFLNLNISHSDVTGVNPLLKPCYCTMNILIPNITRYGKLKPYECEPGVCIPDECDPHECHKLLMKRLSRKKAAMAGTDAKLMLTHGSQSTTSSIDRKLQSGKKLQEKKKKSSPAGIKYSSPCKYHKNAVRIGSSFSFNMEFSKDKLQSEYDSTHFKERKSTMHPKPVKIIRQKSNAQGTSRLASRNKNRNSQTLFTKTKNMPSNTSLMLKRCFCTLKLQKGGRLSDTNKSQNNIEGKSHQETMTKRDKIYKVTRSSIDNVNQNMEASKPVKLKYHLEPYECEPNICVSGECDPYKCLERIKLRNVKLRNVGSGSQEHKTISTSSVTRKHKTYSKGKQIKPGFKDITRGTKETRSEKPTPIKRLSIREPTQQTIRIGSSFSFNVEFYKSTSRSSEPTLIETKSHETLSSSVHEKKINGTAGLTKYKFKDQYSQYKKGTHHKYLQQRNFIENHKSTMTTSLSNRCFCTKKILANDNKKAKNILLSSSGHIGTKKDLSPNHSRPFMKKCLCVLKLLSISNNSKKIPKQIKTQKLRRLNKRQVTDKMVELKPQEINHRRQQRLAPYECEPGICVPGKCNPYVCDKIIKQRKWKQHIKSTNTKKTKTNSSSSSYKSNMSRANKRQTNLKPQQNRQIKSIANTQSPTSEQVKLQQNSISSTPSKSQVVRIGSNVSFNIEFYKDRSPRTDEIQEAAKLLAPSKKIKSISQKSNVNSKTRKIPMKDKRFTKFDRQSQARIQTANKSASSALKRCFCTLKLQNRNPKMASIVPRRIISPLKDEPVTFDKGVMVIEKYKQILEPYECEPNDCIPGECDPKECLKRINERNIKLRESGTITKRNEGKSASSMTYTTLNNRNTQISPKRYKNAEIKTESSGFNDRYPKARKSINSQLSKPSKQAVKLGSNFSFNIEFRKEKSNNNNFSTRIAKPQRIKQMDSISISSNIDTNRNKISQGAKFLHHKDSQVLANKKHDKMTGVHPVLKRCFCTLNLQKSNPPQHIAQNKIKFGPLIKDTRNKIVYLAALQPYECEPGVCVPYECDPTICKKRIRQRMAKSKKTITNKTKLQTSSSSYSSPRNRTISTQRKPHEQKVHKPKLRKYKKPEFSDKLYNRPPSRTNRHVRFGSNFMIGVDFYKDSSQFKPSYTPDVRHIPNIQQKENVTDMKTTNRDICFGSQQKHHHSIPTAVGPKIANRYSYRMLKRCFCALKFQKPAKTGNEKEKNPSCSEKGTIIHSMNTKDKNEYKTIKNGVLTKNAPNLDLYEPNICIRGQCDPYKCYESTKRCQLRNSSTGSRKRHHVKIEDIQLKNLLSNMERYECEPKMCVPGQCNPYKCLELIEQRRVRNSGTDPQKIPKTLTAPPNNVSYKSTGTQLAIKRMAKKLKKQMVNRTTCVCTTKEPPYSKNVKVTELSSGDWPNPQRYVLIQDEGSYLRTKNENKFKNGARKESTAIENIKEKIKKKIKASRGNNSEGNQKNFRIGSKLSIDLEFYKFQSHNEGKDIIIKTSDDQKTNEVPKTHSKSDAKTIAKKRRSSQMRSEKLHRGSQMHSEKIDQGAQIYPYTKDKETGMAFLKRCFCTAPPHIQDKLENRLKNATTTDTHYLSPSFINKYFGTLKLQLAKKKDNVISVHRAAVEEENKMFHNPDIFHNKNTIGAKRNISNKVHDFKNDFNINMDGTVRKNDLFCYCVNCDYNEMTTIYPYLPRKFNKHISKTMVSCQHERSKSDCDRDVHFARGFDGTKPPRITSPLALIKQRKKLTAKQNSTGLKKIERNLNFKEFLYRFAQILKLKTNKSLDRTIEDGSIPSFIKQKKCKVKGHVKAQNEILKLSYSDRYPIDQNVICGPKKSKSLKISKLHENTFPKIIKKNYSRFQSGDSVQSSGVPITHSSHRICQDTNKFNRCVCTYSHTNYNKKQRVAKMPIKSAYADNKLVQFSLITPGKNNNGREKCNECISMEKNNAIVNTMKQSTLGKDTKVYCNARCRTMDRTPNSIIDRKPVISIVNNKEKDLHSLDKYVSFLKPKYLKNREKNKGEKVETCLTDPRYDRTEKYATVSNKGKTKITGMVNFLKPSSLDNNLYDLSSRDKNNPVELRLSNKQQGKALNLIKNVKSTGFESYRKDARLANNQKGNGDISYSPVAKEGLKMQTCVCVLNDTNNEASKDVPPNRSKCSPCCRQMCAHGMRPDPLTIIKHRKPRKPLRRSDLCQCPACECYMCPNKNKTRELYADDWPNPQRYLFIDINEPELSVQNTKTIINKKAGDENVNKQNNKIYNLNAKFSGISKIKQICNIFASFKNKLLSIKNVNNCNKPCHKCSISTDENNVNFSVHTGDKYKGDICKKEKNKIGIKGRKEGEDLITVKKKNVDIRKMCTCGSKVCKKNFDEMTNIGMLGSERKLQTPCDCGTVICRTEREKQEKRAMTKDQRRLLALQKKNFKLQLGRAVKYKIEDEKRRMKQIRKDQTLRKQLRKKVKTSSNWGLVGESIVDIAKLGCRTKRSILRCAVRSITDPKNTITALKTSIKNPKRMAGQVDNAFSTVGFGPTLRRVGTRLCATTPAVSMMNTLEDKFNLQAIGGKKKRKKKRKSKSRQPPVDFACSLFMASLRKKPCLAVYYACPWFYPHCLSFLTIWKQFTDVILFLLAVTVWSPCILAVEICRAFVCCTFCTG